MKFLKLSSFQMDIHSWSLERILVMTLDTKTVPLTLMSYAAHLKFSPPHLTQSESIHEVKCTAILVQDLRVPGGWGPQISSQPAYEGGKVVSPTKWSPLPPTPGNIPGIHSAAGRIMSRKIRVTPSGTEPMTFQLVAQCPNQLFHPVLQSMR